MSNVASTLLLVWTGPYAPSVSKQYDSVSINAWEGNRRPDIALAKRYRLKSSIQLRAQGRGQEDKHAAYCLM